MQDQYVKGNTSIYFGYTWVGIRQNFVKEDLQNSSMPWQGFEHMTLCTWGTHLMHWATVSTLCILALCLMFSNHSDFPGINVYNLHPLFVNNPVLIWFSVYISCQQYLLQLVLLVSSPTMNTINAPYLIFNLPYI